MRNVKYSYNVYTRDRKTRQGTVSAASLEMAEETLLRQGHLRILSLRQAGDASEGTATWKLQLNPVRPADVLNFTKELGYLLNAGISIVAALRLLAVQTKNKVLKATIASLEDELKSGTSFTEALEKHNDIFSPMYCEIVRSAEQTGLLTTGLDYMAEYLEKQETVKKRVRRAVMYPVMVVLLAIGVSALLVTVVLPPLVDLFGSLGARLPLETRVVISLSTIFIDYKYALLAGAAVIVVGAVLYARSEAGKMTLDKFVLKIPFLGPMVVKSNLMRFAFTSSILLRAGVQITRVLRVAMNTVTNPSLRERLNGALQHLLSGESFSSSMEQTGLFPASSIEMMAVGERTGDLDGALHNIADYFERTNSEKLDSAIAMIEPALTICVGLVIGFIALAVITPIYSLAGGM